MKFFDALDVLERDLKAYLGMSLPNKVGAGCQFVVIMQEFLENVQNTSDNSDYAKCQHDYVDINGCVKYMECTKCGDKLI